MSKSDSAARAAELLAESRLGRARMAGLPDDLRPATEADAYQIQEALHDRLEGTAWGRRVGYKIGCTTPVMQAFLSIGNPCSGGVFAPSTHYISATLEFDRFLHAGVECEVAAFMGQGLPPDGAPYTRHTVADAVGALFAAIEIVDDRWEDYRSIDTPSLIADDFFNAGCVLSKPVTEWRSLDIADLKGRMLLNGRVIGEGSSGDILGHPLDALAWMANLLAGRGKSLEQDEVVLLGSVVETRWLEKGDEVEVDVDGLGGALLKVV